MPGLGARSWSDGFVRGLVPGSGFRVGCLDRYLPGVLLGAGPPSGGISSGVAVRVRHVWAVSYTHLTLPTKA